MAEGALRNSRAMVAISLTGNAGPVANEYEFRNLGVVDIGVSVRMKNNFYTETRRFNICESDILKTADASGGNSKYA